MVVFRWFLFYWIGVMIGIIWVDLCKGLNLFIKLVKKINDTLISKLLKQIN